MRATLFLPVWVVVILIFAHGAQAVNSGGICQNVGFAKDAAPLQITFNTFSRGLLGWPANAVGICGLLFATLIGFQIIYTAVMLFLRNEGSIAAMINGLLAELLRLYIPLAIFTQLPKILFAFFNAMLNVGPAITGNAAPAQLGNLFGGFEPSFFAYQGDCLTDSLIQDVQYVFTAQGPVWTNPGGAIQTAIILLPVILGAFIIGLSYVAITYAFYFLALEVYIVGGFFPLVFVLFGTRATQGIPSAAITNMVGLGLKVAALASLAAFGDTLAALWSSQLRIAALTGKPIPLLYGAVDVFLGSVTFALLVVFLPGIIKNAFGGGPAMTIGGVFSFARSSATVVAPAFRGGATAGGGGGGGGGGGPVPVVIVGNTAGAGGVGGGGPRPGAPPPNTVSGKP